MIKVLIYKSNKAKEKEKEENNHFTFINQTVSVRRHILYLLDSLI